MPAAGFVAVLVLASATVCLTSGCSTLGYYAQSVTGHFALLGRAKPVGEVIESDRTTPALKERLALSQRIRDFAVRELKLPDNASYRRYADLGRPAAVWNVVAAPELSLVLKTWCFPVVGCVGYRGYFDRADAEAYGKTLEAEGLEVSVYGVPAYSTLGNLPGSGWFADPLLNTFIDYPEGELARLIFHELAHQLAYAKGDTMFNESFATAVEKIGADRWLAQHASPETRSRFERHDERRQDFRALTRTYRARLDALYRSAASDEEKRTRKAELMAQLRADHRTMKAERWSGYSGYDGWFARANNASFGVLAAYDAWVPNFEKLFEREGRDFERFYAEVRRIAKLSRDERLAALEVSP